MMRRAAAPSWASVRRDLARIGVMYDLVAVDGWGAQYDVIVRGRRGVTPFAPLGPAATLLSKVSTIARRRDHVEYSARDAARLLHAARQIIETEADRHDRLCANARAINLAQRVAELGLWEGKS